MRRVALCFPRFLWGPCFLLALLSATPASAQDEPKPRGRTPRGIITLAEVTITGRIQKPIAAVDVGRLSPKLALSELNQPFLHRIGKAVFKDPF